MSSALDLELGICRVVCRGSGELVLSAVSGGVPADFAWCFSSNRAALLDPSEGSPKISPRLPKFPDLVH